jgi:phosphinothricin acetyltransferase
MARESDVVIRPAVPADAAAICRIYNHYVSATVITFEEEPVTEAEMARRVVEVTSRPLPWLVAEAARDVLGYAYATPWRPRSAYRFSVESTVYLDPVATGRGVGRQLYEALLSELRTRGVHCVIGGIALPNPASVGLHERMGFTKVGHLEEVGWKRDRWVDVGYWELRFET